MLDAPSLTFALLSRVPARIIHAVVATNLDLGQWFTQTVPAGALINGLGLGTMTVLFATDRILTKGQHLRRVADMEKAHTKEVETLTQGYDGRVSDLKAAHERLIVQKDAEIGRLEERHQGTVTRILGERELEREARKIQEARADAMVQQLIDIAQESGKTTVHLLKSLPKVEDPSLS